MGTFRFRLEKVLQWQQKQRQMEETRIQELAHARERAASAIALLRADRVAVEQQVLSAKEVSPNDLVALGNFRRRVAKQSEALNRSRQDYERRLAERRAAWLEARRKCRLFEKLKARRQIEFDGQVQRELEQFATENFLARWPPAN